MNSNIILVSIVVSIILIILWLIITIKENRYRPSDTDVVRQVVIQDAKDIVCLKYKSQISSESISALSLSEKDLIDYTKKQAIDKFFEEMEKFNCVISTVNNEPNGGKTVELTLYVVGNKK